MKKYIVLIGIFMFLITGCVAKNKNNVIKELEKKINNASSYHLTGEMKIVNNEDKNIYEVDVSFEKDDKYRVSLKNKTNNHEQIILKNDDGVYVLTPTLNKSFKFQSDWPYNNSQAYLLQNIINDIKSDKNAKFTNNKDEYIFEVNATYSNNKELKKQRITLDHNFNIKKVEVLDDNNQVIIQMDFDDVDLKANFKNDHFTLKSNKKKKKELKQTSNTINDIIYPMYIPDNTKLTSQERVKLEEGERVILTFTGDKEFTLIEETAAVEDENVIIPVSGEIEMISDVFGYLTDNSVSWISGGIDYYLSSQTMDKTELLSVASSINMLPVSK